MPPKEKTPLQCARCLGVGTTRFTHPSVFKGLLCLQCALIAIFKASPMKKS